MRSGTYHASAEGLDFEVRIEVDGRGTPIILSGDITRSRAFFGAFVCDAPARTPDGGAQGAVSFRGKEGLFTGDVRLSADDRGVGVFELGVHMEGGHRDVFAGRLTWAGTALRRLRIEVDGLLGLRAPTSYTANDGRTMSLRQAYADAGIDAEVVTDDFVSTDSRLTRARGWTPAEIHKAMTTLRSSPPADRLHAHVLVCSYLAGRNGRGVLGLMYDWGRDDLNKSPREGVAVFYDHPMLSDPRVEQSLRDREYIFTLVHEIGHALNLVHSFDKGRPGALSWMNYPDLFPRGSEAGSGYDGSREFWRAFRESFDEQELRHLHHATMREIRAGGFDFGRYEEGLSSIFDGPANPRRTRLGANPLREVPAINLAIGALKEAYDLGEPVFLRVNVRNQGNDTAFVPGALDPSEGSLRLRIRTPSGEIIRYQPPVSMCSQSALTPLEPDESLPEFAGLPLFLSNRGAVFSQPGAYEVRAELTGINGPGVAFSQPALVQVREPDAAVAALSRAMMLDMGAMRALYLRHPLAERDAWHTLRDSLESARTKLPKDNTTRAYAEYIDALGWLTPFREADGTEHPSNTSEAEAKLRAVDPDGLPPSVAQRKSEVKQATRTRASQVLTLADRDGKNTTKPAAKTRAKSGSKSGSKPGAECNTIERVSGLMPLRPAETLRAEIAPGGLFGAIGLEGADTPRTTDPFARVVNTFKGTSRFADIVTWNIEHLHGRPEKTAKAAELIRSFRCDFWGLQEVDAPALERVVKVLNSAGRTRYDFVCVPGKGQQSGAIFRTDTATVRVREARESDWNQQITIKPKNKPSVQKKVFLRPPLVADVRVRQSAGTVDFTAVIVHLKSTDTQLADTGNAWRAAAAKACAEWMQADRARSGERDYIIMGDMNAETSEQGLRAFAKENGLSLLSVGMQQKYGSDQALTRVASKRMLDHIVVTQDAQARMPKEDIDEQTIIRCDTSIATFTKDYSDHIPVAVRLALGRDDD